jgi:dephospho-CoA kinase
VKIIGLTGGIGTGKSAVSEYLLQKGYTVVDADTISREITAPGAEGLAALLTALAAAFGDDVVTPAGALDRRRLAEIVFHDTEKRLRLNAILHGRIGRRIESQLAGCRAAGEAVVFLSAPLLIETGMQRRTDEVWLVDADEETQIRRVMARDGLTAAAARQRIAAQMPAEERRAYADARIDNTGAWETLRRRIDALLAERLGQPEAETAGRETPE